MNNEYEQIGTYGFIKHNGGIEFKKVSESEYQFRVTVQDYHLNPGGNTHGGFLMSILDSGLGTAAYRVLGSKVRIATISLDTKFIAGSTAGDIIQGKARLLRKTRSLVFMQGELLCRGKIIATAEGIWKVL